MFQKRMGCTFPWVSSSGSDFNFDYQVSTKRYEVKGKIYYNYDLTEFPSEERPGLSVFCEGDDGQIFHKYSVYARGLDILLTAETRRHGERHLGYGIRTRNQHSAPSAQVAIH